MLYSHGSQKHWKLLQPSPVKLQVAQEFQVIMSSGRAFNMANLKPSPAEGLQVRGSLRNCFKEKRGRQSSVDDSECCVYLRYLSSLPRYSWVEFVSQNCSWIVCDAWNTMWSNNSFEVCFLWLEIQILKVSTPQVPNGSCLCRNKRSQDEVSQKKRWTQPGPLVGILKSQQFKRYFLQHSITYYLNLSNITSPWPSSLRWTTKLRN